MQKLSSSFAHWFKSFLDNQITNMAKLLIRIKANLLVYEFIAKLVDYHIRNVISILCLKNSNNFVTRRLLVDIKSVCELIASSNKRFFGVNSHINNNLKSILIKFGHREFQFGHVLFLCAPHSTIKEAFLYFIYAEAWY